MNQPQPDHTGTPALNFVHGHKTVFNYWLSIAQNHEATPDDLQKAFAVRHSQNRSVIEALASNPGSPPEMLLDLMEEAPGAFCRNSVAPLLTLEIPDFLEKASELGIARVLRYTRAPANLVQLVADGAVKNDYLRSAAGQHVAVREEIPAAQWREEVSKGIQEFVERDTNDEGRRLLAELAELDLLPTTRIAAFPAEEVKGSQTFEELLAQLDPQKQQALLAGRAEVPKEHFDYDDNPTLLYARVGACFNLEAPVDLLARWVGLHEEAADAVARNPNVGVLLLKSFSTHYETQIRRTALRNPAMTPEIRAAFQRLNLSRALHATSDCFVPRYRKRYHYTPPFPSAIHRLIGMLRAPEPMRRPLFRPYSESPLWEDRLAAALAIGPRPHGQRIRPRHLVLLERLAADGHVLVRAAAQARLRGESFVLS